MIYVNGTTEDAFTFELPTASRTWCIPISTEPRGTDGSVNFKMLGTGDQPHTKFDVYSTDEPEDIKFKIYTTFTNNLVF